MPVQRGKRHKRLRNRGGFDADIDSDAPAATPVRQAATPARRRGWQTPFWINVVLGASMLVFGIFFYFLPQKGVAGTQRLVFLALYFAIAVLYLGKAIRQYLAKRRQL